MAGSPWSPQAAELIKFVYRHWVSERRPPDLAAVHGATGFEYREVRRLYRELQEGFAVVVDDDRLQLGLVKAPPFSATPTPVSAFIGGEFLSYVGCPAESLTLGCLPMLDDVAITIRSYCGCCYQPIEVQVQRQEVVRAPAEGPPLIAVFGSPWDWEHGVPASRVCDTMHFVPDRDHGERLGHLFGRRATYVTMEQMAMAGASIAAARLRDPDWGPNRIDGATAVAGFESLGVDVSEWR